jgi:hypothetical protein
VAFCAAIGVFLHQHQLLLVQRGRRAESLARTLNTVPLATYLKRSASAARCR